MNIKFKIILEDGSFIESHDNMWNQIKDHCHALPPHNLKKWRAYEIWSDDYGLMMGVDFETGLFNIRGQVVHPADENGQPLTFLEGLQNFPSSETTQVLNGMKYFPIFGRRVIKGDWGEAMLPFCGWKKKLGEHTYEKVAYLYPNGQIALT